MNSRTTGSSSPQCAHAWSTRNASTKVAAASRPVFFADSVEYTPASSDGNASATAYGSTPGTASAASSWSNPLARTRRASASESSHGRTSRDRRQTVRSSRRSAELVDSCMRFHARRRRTRRDYPMCRSKSDGKRPRQHYRTSVRSAQGISFLLFGMHLEGHGASQATVPSQQGPCGGPKSQRARMPFYTRAVSSVG